MRTSHRGTSLDAPAARATGAAPATRRPLGALAALAAVALLGACSGGPDVDGSWHLAAGTVDGSELALVDASPVTLTVDGTSVSGTAACNTYFGDVDVADGWRPGEPGRTEKGCDADLMALETAYLGALGRVTAADRDGDDLVLTGDAVKLRFEPPLEG